MQADSERTAVGAGPQAACGEGDAEGMAGKFAEIESRLCAGYDDMRASAREIGDVTSHYVRRHPLAACGLAFMAGITLTRMLRR